MSELKLPPGLWRVMLGTALVVLSYSLLNPVLAVRLQTSGASATAIGVIAMLPFISIVLLVPWVPRLFGRIGVGQAYRAGLILELIACSGYLLTDDYRVWCVLGFMAGTGAAAAWNATEALIAHNVPATHRGRLTGLYQTTLGSAMALGTLSAHGVRLDRHRSDVPGGIGSGWRRRLDGLITHQPFARHGGRPRADGHDGRLAFQTCADLGGLGGRRV